MININSKNEISSQQLHNMVVQTRMELEDAISAIDERNLKLNIPYVTDPNRQGLSLSVKDNKLYVYISGSHVGYVSLL